MKASKPQDATLTRALSGELLQYAAQRLSAKQHPLSETRSDRPTGDEEPVWSQATRERPGDDKPVPIASRACRDAWVQLRHEVWRLASAGRPGSRLGFRWLPMPLAGLGPSRAVDDLEAMRG
jgi:hypothetical protein